MNPHQIYIVLTPEFEGYFNGKSLPAYGRMGKVTVSTDTAIDDDEDKKGAFGDMGMLENVMIDALSCFVCLFVHCQGAFNVFIYFQKALLFAIYDHLFLSWFCISCLFVCLLHELP